MEVRQKMIDYRNEHYISLEKMAKISRVPIVVLSHVEEDGWVTHPNFVKRIKRYYKLTDEEAETLLPENRRQSSPNYDPDKYVHPIEMDNSRLMPTDSEINNYLGEKFRACDHVKGGRS